MFSTLFNGLALTAPAAPTFSWTTLINNGSLDFQPLVDGIASLVPIAIGVAIPLMVINKGWNWIRGVVYSA
jgi:hypothetical protein